jgi:lysyl-tRNA synthetase class 2
MVLAITFTSGRTYDYVGVPKPVYLGLLRASSAGEYFNTRIRDYYSANR